MTPLAALGALVVVLNCMSPVHKPLRRVCQGWLHSQVHQQLSIVAWAQQWTNSTLDKAVLVSAATVTLEFYLTLLPILAWCGYGRQLTLLIALMALQGQAVFGLKDLLESPRPADSIKTAPSSLQVVVRDYSGDIEDGLPSAHCSGSVLLLFYSISAAVQAGWIRPEWQLALQLAAAAWVAWIAFGRLYLAVHSPVDLLSGCILGVCLLELWQLMEQPYIHWLDHDPHLPLHVALICFTVMRLFPMPSRCTAPYGYCTAWLAGWAGVVVGYRVLHPVGGSAALSTAASTYMMHPARQLAALPVWQAGCVLAAKVVTGLLLAFATKTIVKEGMLLVLQRVFYSVPTPVRCLWQPPVAGYTKHSIGDSNGKDWGQQQQQVNKILPHRQQSSRLDSAADCDQNSTAVWDNEATVEKSTSSMWALRYAPDGKANDVVATARFASYATLGFVVITMDAWWQPLLSSVVYASSIA